MEITPYTDGEMNQLLSNGIPKTMKQNNNWANTTYEKWAAAHARVVPDDNVPQKFADLDPERYNFVLSKFIVEVRDRENNYYKSATLYQLISALNRLIKDIFTDQNYDLFETARFRN